jgi:hypothetical protein
MKCDDWSSGRKGCTDACRTKKTKLILNLINDLRVKSMIRVDWQVVGNDVQLLAEQK